VARLQAPPLVILGIDVGEPAEIARWAQQGYLPTIASIMQRGWWGRTAGPEQLCEHGTGLTLFSGISRLSHGHHDLRQLRAGTYDFHSISPYFSKVAPFWAHLRGRGKKVAILDANECRLVPELPGFQLLNWASHEASWPRLRPSADPPELIGQDERDA
jgi:predicted AlkP superfamily phosphohydrolase/phosphomutase